MLNETKNDPPRAGQNITNLQELKGYIESQHLASILGPILQLNEQTGGFANYVFKIGTENGKFFLKHRAPFIKAKPELLKPRETIT